MMLVSFLVAIIGLTQIDTESCEFTLFHMRTIVEKKQVGVTLGFYTDGTRAVERKIFLKGEKKEWTAKSNPGVGSTAEIYVRKHGSFKSVHPRSLTKGDKVDIELDFFNEDLEEVAELLLEDYTVEEINNG